MEQGSPLRMSTVIGSSADWIELQKRAFTAWSNVMLSLIKDRSLEIKDLSSDFKDGVLLSFLIQAAAGVPSIKRNEPQPGKELIKTKAIENLNTALDVATKDGVKLTNIGSNDIYDCNEKLIIGLIWSLILKYQIGQTGTGGGGAKKMLLEWVNEIVPGIKVNDFKKSWSDGKVLAQLVNNLLPGAISQTDIDTLPPVPLTRKSQEVARDQMDVPIIVPAEDLVECADENIQMMMLSYFRNWHSEKTGKDSPGLQRRRKNSTPIPPVVVTTPVKAEPIVEELTPRDREEMDKLRRERDEITVQADELRSSMAVLETGKKDDSDEIERLKAALAAKTKEVEQLDVSNSEKINTIGDQTRELDEKVQHFEALSKEKELVEKHKIDLEEEVRELKSQLHNSKQSSAEGSAKQEEQVSDLQKRLAASSTDNEKLRKQIEVSLREHDEYVVSATANEERVADLTEKLNERTEELEDKNEMVQKLVGDVGVLGKKAKDAEAKLKALVGDFKTEMTTLIQQRNETQAELDKMKGKVSSYSKQLVDLQEQIASSTSVNLEQLENELQKMQLKNEEMQANINKLESEMQEATKRAEALMSMLKDASAGDDDDAAAPAANAGKATNDEPEERYEVDPKLKDRLASAESQIVGMLRFRAEKEAQVAEMMRNNEENMEFLKVLDAKIKASATEKAKLSEEIAVLKTQLDDVKHELEESNNATNVCETDRGDLKRKMEELEKRLGDLEQREKELSEQLKKSNEDNDAAQKTITELKERETVSASEGVLRAQVCPDTSNTNLEKANAEIDSTKQQLEESKKLNNDAEAKNTELTNRNTELNDRVQALNAELDDSKSANSAGESNRSDLNTRLDQLQKDLAEAKSTIATTEASRDELSNRVADLEKELDETKKELEESKKATNVCESDRSDLKNRISELEKDLADTKKGLSDTQEELSGVQSNLADSNKQLGESKDGHSASETDRSALQKRVSDLEKDLSDTKNELDESKKATNVCESDRSDLNKRISELEKELADTKTDLANTKNDLSDSNKQLGESKEGHNATETNRSALNKRVSDLEKELADTKQALTDSEKSLDDTKQTLAGTEKDLNDTKKDLADNKKALEESQNATNVCESDRGELHKKIEQLEASEKDLQNSLSESKTDLDVANKHIEELKKRVATSAGGQEALNAQLDAITKERDSLIKERDSLQRQLQEANEALEKARKELEDAHAQIGERKKDIEAKQKLVDAKSQECDAKQAEIDEHLATLAEANKSLEDKDHSLKQKDVRIKELEALNEQLKNLTDGDAAQAALDIASKDMALLAKERELAEKQSALEAKEKELKSLEKELDSLKKKNDSLTEDLQEKDQLLSESLKSLESKSVSDAALQTKTKEVSDRENDIIQLKNEISRLESELKKTKDEARELEPTLHELAKASKLAEDRGKALNESQKDTESLRVARAELEKLKKEKERLDQELASSRNSNEGSSGEIAILTKRLFEREQELQKLKTEFQEAMANLSDKLAAAEKVAREAQAAYRNHTSASSSFLKYIVPLGLVVVALGAGRLLGANNHPNSS